MNNESIALVFALIVLAFLILVFVIFISAHLVTDFSKELKYLNCEISRTTGAERKAWKAKRRRLWLSILPFVKY